ncbi:MAG TPA: PAS domain S-box protein [Syntrophales bacterium]|nr:PAS domain S-box protein [Syntrophales bacterium]
MAQRAIHIHTRKEPTPDLRFLILEDNPYDAELIENELKQAGFSFTSERVESEEAYIKAIEEFRPDLILSDYDLPIYSGILALSEAKKRSPDSPFILVTGAVTEDRAIEILTSGARDYVLKHRLNRLVPAVRRALAEAEEHKGRKKAEEELLEAHKDLERKIAEKTAELQAELEWKKQAESMLQRNNERLEILSYTAGRLLESGRPEEIVEELCRRVMAFLDCQTFFNYLVVDGTPGYLKLNAYAGIPAETAQGISLLTYGVAVCGCVARDGCRIAAEDIHLKSDIRTGLVKSLGVKAYACHPLMIQGKLVGTLSFGTKTRSSFTEDDLSMMKAIADQVAIAMNRIRMEETLRDNEERLKGVFDNSLDAIIITRPEGDGRIISVNSAASRMFGWNREEMAGLTRKDVIDTQGPELDRFLSRRMETGKGQSILRYRRRDSSTFSGESTSSFFRSHSGELMAIAIIRDVSDRERAESERKQAEEALRKSEEEYRLLVEHAPAGIYEMDYSLPRFSRVNNAMCSLLGYTREELLQMDPLEILEDDSKKLFLERARRAAAGENIEKSALFNALARDGRKICAEINIQLKYADGKPAGALVVAQDVTERVKAEEALHKSEENYRLIYENSLSGIMFTKPDGQILRANPAAQKLLGMTEEELIAAGRDSMMDLSDPRLGPAFEERDRTGKFSGELNYRRKDGTISPAEISSVIFRDKKGESFASVIFQDITWRKESESILLESERRFREMADTIPQLIWTSTPKGHFTYFNTRHTEFPELIRQESGSWEWQKIIHPEDLPETIEVCRRAVMYESDSQVEHRLKTGNGSYRWYLSRGVAIRNEQGALIKWIGTTTDIHDLKEIESALKERTRQLEEANSELESFGYSVSHDLRAPLRAIKGFSGMVLKERPLDKESRHMIRTVRESAERMDRLIEDLLSFSRSSRSSFTCRKVDVSRLVDKVWREQVSSNPDRRMRLKKGKLPAALGDETLIRQVLSNLLSNAVKFSRGKDPTDIEVGGEPDGKEIVYSIRDNGAGFNMKLYDRLFCVFQRLHSGKDYEGTGVGLAIVQRIVRRHGGRVWAEGKEGEGATFYFTLPRN